MERGTVSFGTKNKEFTRGDHRKKQRDDGIDQMGRDKKKELQPSGGQRQTPRGIRHR